MSGAKKLSYIQMGPESVQGTPVAATFMWRGTGFIEDLREPVYPDEDVATLAPQDRAYFPFYESKIILSPIEATYEQLPHLLEMGIAIEVATQDGAGSGYLYAYAFTGATVPTMRSYTIEGGDNQQAEEFDYALCRSFKLVGEAKKAWMMEAELFGRVATPVTKTGSLLAPAVEQILFQRTKLYIDDTTGTIGSTQATSAFLAATLEFNTGIEPRWSGDDSLDYTRHVHKPAEIMLDVTFEHDGAAVTEKANWKAGTAQLIRILAEGNTLGTGATYTKKTMKIDLAGRWETFGPLNDQDGNNIVTGKFRVHEVTADSLYGDILIVNELTVLP